VLVKGANKVGSAANTFQDKNGATEMHFIKSSTCSCGECIEVAWLAGDKVAVRDSKNAAKDPMIFTRAEWTAFIQGVRAGEFDQPTSNSDN
jgi:hypothetical protein